MVIKREKMRLLLFCLLSTSIYGCSNIDNGNHANKKNSLNTAYHVKSEPDLYTNTFFYDSVSIIHGVICKKAVCFIADEAGDSCKHKDYIIAIAVKSISVINPQGVDTSNEDNNPNERNIDTIQLILQSDNNLIKRLGQTVQLTGTFLHADNGNHFTNILMMVKKVR